MTYDVYVVEITKITLQAPGYPFVDLCHYDHYDIEEK